MLWRRLSMSYLAGMEKLKELAHELVKAVRACTSICISTHKDADPDAVASAIALKHVIQSTHHNPSTYVILPEGLNKVASRLVMSLNMERELSSALTGQCDLHVFVDASSRYQVMSPGGEGLARYIVIDHHESNELTSDALLSIHFRDAASTSELLALMMECLNITPYNNLVTLLISGILYDTKNLRLAKPTSFKALYHLTSMCPECFNQAYSLLTGTEVVRSEVVAVLKGISRIGIYELNKDLLLAITCVGAYEASVLKTVINAGADVAIAISQRSGETRIYVRASQRAINTLKTPIAADIATQIAKSLGGSGGGHEGAAGVVVPSSVCAEGILENVRQYFTRAGMRFEVLEEGRWIEKCS
ncbi:MAG: DHH family phosphoesterase [Zestosphaera sp.]